MKNPHRESEKNKNHISGGNYYGRLLNSRNQDFLQQAFFSVQQESRSSQARMRRSFTQDAQQPF